MTKRSSNRGIFFLLSDPIGNRPKAFCLKCNTHTNVATVCCPPDLGNECEAGDQPKGLVRAGVRARLDGIFAQYVGDECF